MIAPAHSGIAEARALSVATVANMKQNLAFVYNALGVPLATGLFYAFTGWLLSPMIAALAMSLSSASVIFNALRLRGRWCGWCDARRYASAASCSSRCVKIIKRAACDSSGKIKPGRASMKSGALSSAAQRPAA